MDDETRRYGPPRSGGSVPLAIGAPDISQEDTIISRGITTDDFWRGRVTRRLPPERSLPPWAVPVIIAVLLAILLPSILGIASVFADYTSLKNLGESGMRHLLNAKADLSGILGGISSNNSLSSLLNDNAMGDAPYTYFVQRQGGTADQVNVTIHPASNMPKSVKTKTYKQTLDTNTALTLGGTPPTSATTTPTPTPKPGATATPSGSGDSGFSFDPAAVNRAVSELHLAQKDFQSLRTKLANPDWVLSLAPRVPGVGSQVNTATTLANIGYDA